MHLVVPMSGFGERFRRAGYAVPKPLIEVAGQPIIAHVLDMFPGVERVTFICNEEHLASPDYRMREQLLALRPDATIFPIAPHRLGPVHALLTAAEVIPDDESTMVSYCDFSARWDFAGFRNWVEAEHLDGAIQSYSNFHPHMLRTNKFAYLRTDASGLGDAIQEKQPFTDKPMEEHASSGAYWFRTGALLKQYCQRLTDGPDLTINGENYVSLVYHPMLADGLRVKPFAVEHFLQWGTPEDLADFEYWQNLFTAFGGRAGRRGEHPGSLLMPMAGAGSRFRQEGFSTPKPLIEVLGTPMTLCALSDLPRTPNRTAVLRRDLEDLEQITAALANCEPPVDVFWLEKLTEGQAITCLEAARELNPDAPLTIAACDNGVLFDASALPAAMDAADLLVWTCRGHPGARLRPESYGWIDADEAGVIQSASVKRALQDPDRDPVIIGCFTFRRCSDFIRCTERLIERDARVNGEFYVDEAVNDALALGLSCRIFEVDGWPVWGTPDEWRAFHYWHEFFTAWPHHPYAGTAYSETTASGDARA